MEQVDKNEQQILKEDLDQKKVIIEFLDKGN